MHQLCLLRFNGQMPILNGHLEVLSATKQQKHVFKSQRKWYLFSSMIIFLKIKIKLCVFLYQ